MMQQPMHPAATPADPSKLGALHRAIGHPIGHAIPPQKLKAALAGQYGPEAKVLAEEYRAGVPGMGMKPPMNMPPRGQQPMMPQRAPMAKPMMRGQGGPQLAPPTAPEGSNMRAPMATMPVSANMQRPGPDTPIPGAPAGMGVTHAPKPGATSLMPNNMTHGNTRPPQRPMTSEEEEDPEGGGAQMPVRPMSRPKMGAAEIFGGR